MATDIILLGSICSAILAVFSVIATLFLIMRKGRKVIKNVLHEWTGVSEINSKLDEHFKQAENRDNEIKALKASNLYCVKKELREVCENVISKEYMTFHEQELIVEGKSVYHMLNGNGIMCEKIDSALKQPIKENGGNGHGRRKSSTVRNHKKDNLLTA